MVIKLFKNDYMRERVFSIEHKENFNICVEILNHTFKNLRRYSEKLTDTQNKILYLYV
jgi:hypothetical protein